MSIGITGTLDEPTRMAYAIACTYRLQPGATNKRSITCKFCGATVEAGAGVRIHIIDYSGPLTNTAYVCGGCAGWISRHVQGYLDRRMGASMAEYLEGTEVES